MSKISVVMYAMNDVDFIETTLDGIYNFADTITIFMGSMPFTFFFTSPEHNSIDGTKEKIERYIKDKDPQKKIEFVHSLFYSNNFDDMKPYGFKYVGERHNPTYIFEVLANELYLDKDLIDLRKRLDNNEMQCDIWGVNFRHFFRLLRWSFTMGSEARVFKYKPGRYMKNQSYVCEANGQTLTGGDSGITCYHLCPSKGLYPYWMKYICYSMRGAGRTIVTEEDRNWAFKVLTDEGHLRPIEDIEFEMNNPPSYGAHMATQHLGPWPENMMTHPRWDKEVNEYYLKKGYHFENGVFVK